MLALLQGRLDEARDAGEAVLKLEPEDLEGLYSQAGLEGDAVDAFRALVRSNLVRLRGRWREGISGEMAPVYLVRLAGRELRGREDEGWRGAGLADRAENEGDPLDRQERGDR